MKKKLLVGIMVCTMVIGGFAAYASDGDDSLSQRGYGNIMERSDEYYEDDNINNNRNENNRHMTWEEMDEFHKENGFDGRHCHDRNSNGKLRRGMYNLGNGMMRRNNK